MTAGSASPYFSLPVAMSSAMASAMDYAEDVPREATGSETLSMREVTNRPRPRIAVTRPSVLYGLSLCCTKETETPKRRASSRIVGRRSPAEGSETVSSIHFESFFEGLDVMDI